MGTQNQRVILKLSGEALGENGRLFSHEAFEAAAQMLASVRRTGVELAVVIGGGNVWRGRRGAATRMGAVAADQMGMLATLQNSLYMRDALERLGETATVMSAVDIDRFAEPYNAVRATRLLAQGHIVLLACGTGNPFFTTDTAAALRGAEVGAEVVLKATKVDGVYTADPQKDPEAKRYTRLSFDEAMTRNLGIMDATAFALCRDQKLPVRVFSIVKPGALLRVVLGEDEGTLVYA